MKTLLTMRMSIAVDGDDFHVSDDTQTHGSSWSEVYRGMVMLRDELNRQLAEGKFCPYHPKYGNQGADFTPNSPGELPGEAVAGRQPGDHEREQGSERKIQ